jgi:uncharacterized membrane protein
MSDISSNDNGKTAGIISYFTIIGWLIAYFALYKDNKTALASYQLRQTLLFHLVSLVIYYAGGALLGIIFLSWSTSLYLFVYWIINAGLFVIWIIGLIGAINGDQKPIPLIGDKAQSVFAGI